MIKIHRIDSYRDGGSISILITNVEPMLLKQLSLPDTPKYAKGRGHTEAQYEIWRSYKIGGEDRGKYYWGDINGKYIELEDTHPMIERVKELLSQERQQRVYYIDKFIDPIKEGG